MKMSLPMHSIVGAAVSAVLLFALRKAILW
jgi:hypothetical protein